MIYCSKLIVFGAMNHEKGDRGTCSTKNKDVSINRDGETLLIRLNAEGLLLPGPVGGPVGLRINSFKLDEAYSRNLKSTQYCFCIAIPATTTEASSNRVADNIYIHLPFHPDDISRRQIRTIYDKHLAHHFNNTLGVKRASVAYSRPKKQRRLCDTSQAASSY